MRITVGCIPRTLSRRRALLLTGGAVVTALAACTRSRPTAEVPATPSPAATTPPGTPIASPFALPANNAVNLNPLYYRGRTYLPAGGGMVFSGAPPTVQSGGSPGQAVPGGPVFQATAISGAAGIPPTPEPTPQADRAVAETFCRWQSGGEYPAGTALYSVVGRPVEEMIAARAGGKDTTFRADDRFPGLASTQVVLGTVTATDPARWTTPDGRPPAQGETAAEYTRAVVRLERRLQGLIPAVPEIEVRQRQRLPGLETALPVVPLEPGRQVILFLQPGQWPSGAPGDVPAGDYYWTGQDQVCLVEAERVRPLGGTGDDPPLALARFLEGIAETFQGVTPRDPHGPPPDLVFGSGQMVSPPPAARYRPGQTVNLAQEHRLAGAQSLYLREGSARATTITDPARIAAIVAALDRPLPVVGEARGTATPVSGRDTILLGFTLADRTYVALEYHRQAGTLVSLAGTEAAFGVAAPDGFAATLGLN